MKGNTNEKSLIKVNENNIFYKIKQFFRNLFHKNDIDDNITTVDVNNMMTAYQDKRNSFMEELKKKSEDEETLLLKLQKKYRNGEIKEEDLTQEQVNALCELYDKQIDNLKKSNEIRKQKLLEYRRLQKAN